MVKKYKIMFLLVFAMFCVSTSPILGRLLSNVPSVGISFWRMAIGATILWIYSFFIPQESLSSKNKSFTILGGFFLGIHFQFFFESIKLTTIANATFLGTLAPIFTLFLEKFWLKRKISLQIIYALVIIFIGSVIIIGNQFDVSSNYTKGNLYALICSFWISLAFMISENVRKEADTISYSRTMFTSAAFTLLVISFYNGDSLMNYSKMDYLGLFLLGLIPTIFGHSILYYSLRYVQPTIVASFPVGEPIIASILAYFIFSESIGMSIYVGGTLTLIGLLVLARSKSQ